MKRLKKTLAVLTATGAVATVLAGSIPLVCGLTGQELKQCCCQLQDGKLVCQETGNVLDKCCCTK